VEPYDVLGRTIFVKTIVVATIFVPTIVVATNILTRKIVETRRRFQVKPKAGRRPQG
jgi:hypothetical protein